MFVVNKITHFDVLGLVLLELGWAGVGISWLALFYPRTQHCSLPYSLKNVVLGKKQFVEIKRQTYCEMKFLV